MELAGHRRISCKGANTRAVPICAKIELEIAQLDPADAAAFMADLGLRESGLDRVIRASYDLLGYISFFTVGEDENRAWSIPRGTNAQNAAGEIHTDIQRGFIRAEVCRYEHLLARGTLAACRDHARAPARGQGIHRPRRRRHQLPPRDVIRSPGFACEVLAVSGSIAHVNDGSSSGGAGAVRARRRRGARPRADAGAEGERGYEAELVSVPFKWYPKEEILPHAAAWRLLDLSESNGRPIDLVIASKFPTYFVRHPNKVAWLIHQYRAAYELCGTPYSDFGHNEQDVGLRDTLIRLDTEMLGECRHVFANAQNTANRVRKYNGLAAEALYHPPRLAGAARGRQPGVRRLRPVGRPHRIGQTGGPAGVGDGSGR